MAGNYGLFWYVDREDYLKVASYAHRVMVLFSFSDKRISHIKTDFPSIFQPIVSMPFEPIPRLPSHLSGESSEDKKSSSEEEKLATPLAPHVMLESTTKPACMICEYILHFIQEQGKVV